MVSSGGGPRLVARVLLACPAIRAGAVSVVTLPTPEDAQAPEERSVVAGVSTNPGLRVFRRKRRPQTVKIACLAPFVALR